MELNLIDLLQWAVLGPLAWFWKEIKDMRALVEHVRASRPSREEMEKYVSLAQRPTEVLLAQILERLTVIEATQREMAHGRPPKKD